jgi:hypothetical protein
MLTIESKTSRTRLWITVGVAVCAALVAATVALMLTQPRPSAAERAVSRVHLDSTLGR